MSRLVSDRIADRTYLFRVVYSLDLCPCRRKATALSVIRSRVESDNGGAFGFLILISLSGACKSKILVIIYEKAFHLSVTEVQVKHLC